MAGKVTLLKIVSLMLIFAAGCTVQRKYTAKEVYESGLAEYYSGNYTTAAGNFREALSIKKEYAAPMLGLAKCHLQFAKENYAQHNSGAALQNLLDARYWIDQALDADPGNPEITRTRVEVMKLRGEMEQGIKTADWGTAVQGPNPSSLLLKARTYENNGAYDEAEVAYKQAIAVAPKNVDVRMQAGRFYEKIGKRDLALQQYEEAWRQDPTSSEAQQKIVELGGNPQAGQ